MDQDFIPQIGGGLLHAGYFFGFNIGFHQMSADALVSLTPTSYFFVRIERLASRSRAIILARIRNPSSGWLLSIPA
jgi:hypothetical protein